MTYNLSTSCNKRCHHACVYVPVHSLEVASVALHLKEKRERCMSLRIHELEKRVGYGNIDILQERTVAGIQSGRVVNLDERLS